MRHRWLLIPLLLLAAAPARAQVGGAPRDSAALRLRSAGAERLRLGLARIPLPFPTDLPALRSIGHGPIWSPFVDPTAEWAAAVRSRLAASPGSTLPGVAPSEAPTLGLGSAIAGPRLIPEALEDVIDLGMRVSGRGELGGAWTRYKPCDPALQLNCNPSLLPLLKPDVQFGVVVQGTVSDRIHVDVDYDQRREFDAANNINIYYQGLEGEVLQRVEVGDVSIRLPASRYLTEGVPGGNFGFKAAGRLGGLDVEAIWAQQKGDVATREFRLDGARGAGGLVQDARIVLDDADYVAGQFFFLVDPLSLAGAPHADILSLHAGDAPATARPARGAEIQLYRDERPSLVNPEQQAQLGYFLAEGVAADGVLRHRGQYRRLVPGEDYWVHPSGLWIMLRSPLRNDEALAVAFPTEAGGTVGTPDAERVRGDAPPTLLLLRGPATIHQPGQATWDFEMHQVYRLDGSAGVEAASVELAVSLGEPAAGVTFTAGPAGPLSFLKLFGLDEDAPAEWLDEAQLFQPAADAADGIGGGGLGSAGGLGSGAGARFGGTYVVFPTLRPFAEPPPVPSAGLDEAGAAALLGADANPAIYDDPDPVARDAGARFRLSFRYRVRMEGLVSSFSLGAFGIREGSETITVDGRPLRRDVDYAIDYDLGQVTLSNAQSVFGANPEAEIRATWEQKSLFQIAPTTLFGLNAHYPLGAAGELNLVGLYQAEKTLANRPQLGLEPASILLGGMSGSVDLGAGWLDRALGGLAGAADSAFSRLRLSGELALSMPNPNRRGATFLDDFEATDEIRLGLDRGLWRLGSRPDDPAGAEVVLPFPLDVATAAPLVWQHDLLDAAGRVVGPRLAREIDQQISVAGAQRTEPVLYLTLGDAATPAAERRWRSVTTVLETTGRDMSRSEYLEFYASAQPGQQIALVLDIGTVSEDAFYFDATGATAGVYADGRPWGLGILDEEARVAAREIWSIARDTLGLWDQACRADPAQQSYSPGDPRANCTRGNGLVDTEDLDGNGILDGTDGAHFRYVVLLDGASPYLIRDRTATGTEFGLYRIPLRGPDAIPVNGATEGTWRYIKHLRVTVAGLPAGIGATDLSIARLRVVGSRWTKRDVHGIFAGTTGDEAGLGATTTGFRVGPVSRITDGAAYASPPGVGDELQDPTSAYGTTGVEYNERSIRLAYRALEPGERAEAYFRYPQQPRNLLAYRELRLWALPRAGQWGADGERLIVSLGTDARNRYVYRSPLRPAPAADAVRTEDWAPEVVIDFERWFELKAVAEQALLAPDRPSGLAVEVWSADSAYAVILEDRARAPNLAAVRELAFAVYNAGGTPVDGEVWVDELRVGGAVRDAGLAGRWDVDLQAGSLGSLGFSYGNRGALFRQLGADPGYQAASDLSAGGTIQLGRLLPAALRLDAPVTVTHVRTGLEPTFLERSDLRADRLQGLRSTGAERTRIGLLLRRAEPTGSPAVGWLVDGLQLRLGYETASAGAITSRDEARAFDGGIGYSRRPAARGFDLTPGPVEGLLRGLLPRALEESALFRRIAEARLRWSPDEISVATSYSREERRSYRYTGILGSAADAAVAPIEAPAERMETTARLGLRPLSSLSAALSLTSRRDLLAPGRASPQPLAQQAIDRARRRLGGLDVGWETDRSLGTRLDFRPRLAAWLLPGVSFNARFRGDRSPSYWQTVADGADSTAVLQGRFQADRQLTRSLLVDFEGLARSLDDGDDDAILPLYLLLTLGRALRPVDLSWTTGVGSRFDRQIIEPGLGYQLGLGDRDAFRVIDGDTAAAADSRRAFRARGGLRLPLGAGLDVAYAESESEALALGGGDRSAAERTWPDLRLAWTDLPIPDAIDALLVHGSASVGYRRAERAQRYGTPAGQARESAEASVPLQFTVGFGNGLSGSYTGSLSSGEAVDPTGRTEQQGAQHAVQVAGSFLAPGSLRERLPAPIQAALRFSRQDQRQCRLQGGHDAGTPCVPFVDLTQRQFSLTLDTILSQLTVGFQMSYNDRRSYVGLLSGSSQFQLGLFGEFNFAAGTFSGGVR